MRPAMLDPKRDLAGATPRGSGAPPDHVKGRSTTFDNSSDPSMPKWMITWLREVKPMTLAFIGTIATVIAALVFLWSTWQSQDHTRGEFAEAAQDRTKIREDMTSSVTGVTA